MNTTNEFSKHVELRNIKSKSKDVIEGNSRILLLNHVTVPWSVISRQLKHIAEYSQKTDPESIPHRVTEETPTQNAKVLDNDLLSTTNHSDNEAIQLSQMLMWISLPAMVLSIIAILSVGILVILLIVWGLTGASAPSSIVVSLALIGTLTSLIAGPLVVYSDHVEGQLRTEYVRLLEDKVKKLGGKV